MRPGSPAAAASAGAAALPPAAAAARPRGSQRVSSRGWLRRPGWTWSSFSLPFPGGRGYRRKVLLAVDPGPDEHRDAHFDERPDGGVHHQPRGEEAETRHRDRERRGGERPDGERRPERGLRAGTVTGTDGRVEPDREDSDHEAPDDREKRRGSGMEAHAQIRERRLVLRSHQVAEQPFARVDDERCRKAAEKDPLPVDAAHPWDTLSAVTDLLERKVGSLTVRIDRTTCIGTANCAKVAPELFVLDDERIVTFREPAAEVPADRVVEACDVCPVD